jgi:phage-related protein
MIANRQIYYYTSINGANPAKEFLDSLQKIQKAKVFRIFKVYQQYGLTSIIPHTKKLKGSPLWEIRIRGKDNIRLLYAVYTQKAILILHGFVKKTQQTPQKEMDIALERYKDWKNRY